LKNGSYWTLTAYLLFTCYSQSASS